MTAITKITPPTFKPRDIVGTPDRRTARVLEILPGHRRRVRYLDGKCEVVDLEVDRLTLEHEGPVRPWPERTL